MLDASLAGIRGGLGTDRLRDVSAECDPAFAGSPCHGKERRGRQSTVDFHEVHSHRDERVHGRSAFLRIPSEQMRNGDVAALEIGAGRDDPRTDESPRGDGLPPKA